MPWADFAAHVDGTDPLSSWGARQVEQLRSLGPDPFAWATGDLALLPCGSVAVTWHWQTLHESAA